MIHGVWSTMDVALMGSVDAGGEQIRSRYHQMFELLASLVSST